MEPELDPASRLLTRLDATGAALAASGHALALFALGSGQDVERIDAWSDLDFFAIVEAGRKARYLDSLDWLAAARPILWRHRNTVDGYQVLMDDGVFCEFAVFEPEELAPIPFAPGRIVWRRDDVDPSIAFPRRPLPGPASADQSWLVGELLSCLYVGMQRWQRGEKLSAMRVIQGHAVDRMIELETLRENAAGGDPFDRARRVEQRLPGLAPRLMHFTPGYASTPAAAAALLDAAQTFAAIGKESAHAAIVERIRAAIDGAN